MENLFMAHAMEQEGDLSTRFGKLNKFAKLLGQSFDPNSDKEQDRCFIEAGFQYNDVLTDSEASYVVNKLA